MEEEVSGTMLSMTKSISSGSGSGSGALDGCDSGSSFGAGCDVVRAA